MSVIRRIMCKIGLHSLVAIRTEFGVHPFLAECKHCHEWLLTTKARYGA